MTDTSEKALKIIDKQMGKQYYRGLCTGFALSKIQIKILISQAKININKHSLVFIEGYCIALKELDAIIDVMLTISEAEEKV